MPRKTLPSDVQRLVDKGQKIAAIKRYRELTGSSLSAAVAAIEGASDHPANAQKRSSDMLPADVQGLLRQGRRMEAIRALRIQWGADLPTAHEAIKDFEDQHPELLAHRRAFYGKTVRGVVQALLIFGLIVAGLWVLGR